MNDQNLIPTNRRSKSEARELGRKGGLTRAANARRRKEHEQRWQELLAMKDVDGLTFQEKLDKALIERARATGDPNAYEKIMEYSGLSVRLELLQEDRKIKQEELKLKKKQSEQEKPETDTAAADAWTNVLGQIRGVMEQDEDSAGS